MLEKEQNRLEEQLGQFAHRNPKAEGVDFDTNFPELGDKEDENAAEVAVYSDNLSLEGELEKALRDVMGALKRLEEGTYGICKYCNQEIPAGRLKARPTSGSCMDCKKTLTQEM